MRALYSIDDIVRFSFDGEEYIGKIAIIDAFGIFFDNSQPYYDIFIFLEDQKILVKHVPQTDILGVNNDEKV